MTVKGSGQLYLRYTRNWWSLSFQHAGQLISLGHRWHELDLNWCSGGERLDIKLLMLCSLKFPHWKRPSLPSASCRGLYKIHVSGQVCSQLATWDLGSPLLFRPATPKCIPSRHIFHCSHEVSSHCLLFNIGIFSVPHRSLWLYSWGTKDQKYSCIFGDLILSRSISLWGSVSRGAKHDMPQ